MMTLRNLQKRYGETVALKGIDLEVSKGELFAYPGPNREPDAGGPNLGHLSASR